MFSDHELKVNGPPKTYDNTIMVQANECKRKLYWFLRGFDYETTPPYFAAGRAWGAAQGAWAAGKNTVQDAIDAATEEWFASNAGDGRDHDTLENIIALFKLYAEVHPDEPFEVIGAEKGWEYPIPGTEWFFGGAMDQYIYWPEFGIMTKEDKTTSMWLTDQYISQWTYSDQVTGYIWYLNQIKGEEAYGCLMDLACKRIKKSDTGSTPQFARSVETRSVQQLNEYVERSIEAIVDIHLAWDRWTWPKTKNHINCVGGVGKSPCLFRGVCLNEAHFTKLNPLMYEGITERNEPWEPWKRGGK